MNPDAVNYFYHEGYISLRQMERAMKGKPFFVIPLKKNMTVYELTKHFEKEIYV